MIQSKRSHWNIFNFFFRILRESLSTAGLDGNVDNTELDTDNPPAADPLASLSEEDQLNMVMQLSMQEDAEVERRRKEEEEEIAMILALSLTDKWSTLPR